VSPPIAAAIRSARTPSPRAWPSPPADRGDPAGVRARAGRWPAPAGRARARPRPRPAVASASRWTSAAR